VYWFHDLVRSLACLVGSLFLVRMRNAMRCICCARAGEARRMGRSKTMVPRTMETNTNTTAETRRGDYVGQMQNQRMARIKAQRLGKSLT